MNEEDFQCEEFESETDTSDTYSDTPPISITQLSNNNLCHPGIIQFPYVNHSLVVPLLNYWGRLHLGSIQLGEGRLSGPALIINKYAQRSPVNCVTGLKFPQDKKRITDLLVLRDIETWHPCIRIYFGTHHLGIFLWLTDLSPWRGRNILFHIDMTKYPNLDEAVQCCDSVYHPQINMETWRVDWKLYCIP